MVAQGTTLAGRYRLDTRIGAGGMGEVWRGEDIVLARTVAVKVLLPGRMDDSGFLARFQGEARAMATINHAGVVDVYDYGVSGDTVYLVMKFVDGESLDKLLGRLGRIAPEPAMELIAQAASALQAVHDQGIVHRDVKPGNLLVQRDGTLVLTDFGIARSDLANRLTDAGMVLGTAAYCAPEQAEGAPVTPAVDIYALGVVAYECLVGQRPFDGDSAVTIALKHIREAPPPLPAEIPAPVRALVETALSKDPARRFASAADMSRAARQAAAGQLPDEVAAAPAQPPAEPYQTGVVPGAYQSGQAPQQTGQGPHQTGTGQVPYPTGAMPSPPGDDNQTVPAPRGGRRAAKAPRRGGLVAAIAIALVLGAGAGAVAITGMTTGGEPEVTGKPAGIEDDVTSKPPTTKPPKTARPRPTPTYTPTPTRDLPTQEPTDEPTEEPAKPSKSPSPTPKPTKSPSPTPTPTVEKRVVPAVVNMKYPEARRIILEAGFGVRVDDQERGAFPERCLTVVEQNPGSGTKLELKKPVLLTLVNTELCPTSPPALTPSATPKQ
ncbi:serine/threonine-protein kinase [Nonomuraea typhae]|uniref:serine/threonine-protein kinase n=1 Tax=Nonomuraea typhae TaxID=2603600 RepID=UPI0012F976F0|nr:serine/threonine-protein kinase [Nonomuraea typhae]